MSDVSNVVSLPVAFRPHVIAGEGAPENVSPRREFGQRKVGFLAGGFAEVLDTARGREQPSDREQQDRIKRLAREARNALDGGKHVDPSLIVALAARISGVASHLEQLAAEAKAYGLLKATVQLREHAGLLELCANEIDPTEPSEPA